MLARPRLLPRLCSRVFDRDFHYRVRRKGGEDADFTPLLIGGDSERFLWAIPMSRLNDQPLVTELLELAPLRSYKPSGVTPEDAHSGVEIIHVIHGRVKARLTYPSEAPGDRELRSGDCIHFHSRFSHKIKNTEKGTTALLLLVRLPKLA